MFILIHNEVKHPIPLCFDSAKKLKEWMASSGNDFVVRFESIGKCLERDKNLGGKSSTFSKEDRDTCCLLEDFSPHQIKAACMAQPLRLWLFEMTKTATAQEPSPWTLFHAEQIKQAMECE